jgi:hypothetical protein
MRVDRESGVLYGCKLLGGTSKNGRRYTDRAMREGASRYEGVKVYRNHPVDGKLADRPVQEVVGVVRNARYRDNAIWGDVHLRKSSPLFAEMVEIAENFHDTFGFSHVAEGSSFMERDGIEVVDEITAVHSVDLVSEAATVSGLFESISDNSSITKLAAALKEIVMSEPGNQKLSEVCTAFLAEVSAMISFQQAAAELSPDEEAEEPAGPPVRESFGFIRKEPSADEIKRFVNSLR